MIVVYRTTPNQSDHSKLTGKGGDLKGNFDKVKSVTYKIKAKDLDSLESDDNVAYVAPVRQMKAHAFSNVQETTGAYIAPSYVYPAQASASP